MALPDTGFGGSYMNLKGERQLQARFRALSHTEQLVRRIVIRGVREAKLLVPRKTGNLGRTIRVGNVSRNSGDIRAGGVRNVGYARAVELGSRPHIIRPKKAKVLAWGGSRTLSGRLSAGSKPTHFARSVRHPGNKPQPFLQPGLRKAVTDEGLTVLVELWNKGA